jgi:hypothetical protein
VTPLSQRVSNFPLRREAPVHESPVHVQCESPELSHSLNPCLTNSLTSTYCFKGSACPPPSRRLNSRAPSTQLYLFGSAPRRSSKSAMWWCPRQLAYSSALTRCLSASFTASVGRGCALRHPSTPSRSPRAACDPPPPAASVVTQRSRRCLRQWIITAIRGARRCPAQRIRHR